MIGWGSDSLLLASLKGVEQVAVYAVAQRFFQFASQPFAILNAPLWAAYADAYARGDTPFLRHTLRRSLSISFVGAVAVSGLLLLVGPVLVPIWTDGAITVPTLVLLLFAGSAILEITGNAFAMYLNGCGIVRQQVWVVGAFCLVAIPMKLYCGSRWGIAGLLGATIATYIVVVVGLYAFVFRPQVLRPLRVAA
jgi:O-antigen/teichoic acid export membrane protein